MEQLKTINYIIATIFFICYAYQFAYIPISLFLKNKPHGKAKPHRYAVLISARNEEHVIGQLIQSIHEQTYDQKLITVFVVADNCTDQTAQIARKAGAVVYERFNTTYVGKGYALDELLQHIETDYPEHPFEGYFVFDADNILDRHYIEEMNKTFSDGYQIITSYRNSKNYGDNWISAGYALWFLREARYLNNARMLLGTSCAVSGTGFLFSSKIMEKTGGWKFYLLTEDIEFTIHNVTKGEKIGYCPTAILYDEQPTTFRQSWRQRMRWAKGFLQVFCKYGGKLFSDCLKGSFSAYDMTMTTMPAMLLSILGVTMDVGALIFGLLTKDIVLAETAAQMIGEAFISIYFTTFIVGAFTTVTEWKQIHTSTGKKIFYLFTFPLFMMTYIPIALVSLFKKVEWLPIEHKCPKTLENIVTETK